MIISRTQDCAVIKSVMKHPEIWKVAAEDHIEIAEWEPEVKGECWLQIVVNDELIGLYNIHALNSVTAEIHAQVLPEYRKKHSKLSAALVLAWIIENEPQYQKIVANIPLLYENVINFTLNAGFQCEGVNRQSYLKDGKLYDVAMLGITKPEIVAFLEQQ